MTMNTLELPPHVQKQVDHNIPGTDILHGYLKECMVDAEEQLILAQAAEDETGEAIDSMDRKYWEGQLDALTEVYTLTYNLSFAIDERIRNREKGGK